jgi:hypothetical protein
MVMWYIFPFWYVVAKTIWRPWPGHAPSCCAKTWSKKLKCSPMSAKNQFFVQLIVTAVIVFKLVIQREIENKNFKQKCILGLK